MADFKKLVENFEEQFPDVRNLDLNEIKGIQAGKEIALNDVTNKRNYYALLSLLIFNILMAGYQIYLNESDDIAISYSLPDLRNMDAPVILKEADKGTIKDADIYLKGFVRQYLRARYPKSAQEVKMMYEYVAKHSKGNVRRDFLARLERIEEIKTKIDGGATVSVYPKKSDGLKIRKNGILGNWIAEFDGRYVSDMGTEDSARAYVKVRLEITQDTQSIKNSPSGFYVVDYKVTYFKDGVTNEIIDIGI